jgi:acyl carrier protein
MNPNLEQAIVLFLANEFHLRPEDVLPDTDFFIDFNLNEDQVAELITRIQDALEFAIPEEKVAEIHTVGDLFTSLRPEELDATI